jgi:hypothetical protein
LRLLDAHRAQLPCGEGVDLRAGERPRRRVVDRLALLAHRGDDQQRPARRDGPRDVGDRLRVQPLGQCLNVDALDHERERPGPLGGGSRTSAVT